MGLDCYIPGTDEGGRIGSYSGVHTLREILIKAAIEYVNERLIEIAFPQIFKYFWRDETNIELPDHLLNSVVNKFSGFQTEADLEWKKKFLKELQEDAEKWATYLEKLSERETVLESHAYSYVVADQILSIWYQPRRVSAQSKSNNSILSMLANMGNSMPIRTDKFGDLQNDYDNLSLVSINLSGVYKFCNHSDCEGHFTPGDCFDISVTMNKLIPYISDEEASEWMATVQSYFEKAFELRKPLVFC